MTATNRRTGLRDWVEGLNARVRDQWVPSLGGGAERNPEPDVPAFAGDLDPDLTNEPVSLEGSEPETVPQEEQEVAPTSGPEAVPPVYHGSQEEPASEREAWVPPKRHPGPSGDRPYKRLKADELERLRLEHLRDRDVLCDLLDELRFRKSSRAAALSRRVLRDLRQVMRGG